jgi:ABC-type nitrate/sulfonate/bicarbonate transport system substrate-binding protein
MLPSSRVWWLLLALALAACSRALERCAESERLRAPRLRYQSIPGEVTFAELAEELGYLAPIKLRQVGTTISGPQDIQTVATGDIDFGPKYWKSTGIAGRGGLIADKEFKVWLDWLVRDGDLAPGQVKLSDAFTNEFNPARRGAL